MPLTTYSTPVDIAGNPLGNSNPAPQSWPAGAGTDRSVTKPTLGTQLATVAANDARLNFVWQNQSAGDLQIVLYNGADYSVILSTGVGANSQGDGGSLVQLGIRHTGRIDVCGASGAQFMAREY